MPRVHSFGAHKTFNYRTEDIEQVCVMHSSATECIVMCVVVGHGLYVMFFVCKAFFAFVCSDVVCCVLWVALCVALCVVCF